MKIFWLKILLLSIIFSCNKDQDVSIQERIAITQPDHIIIVILENHSYDSIIGNPDAEYINSLADSGYLFKNFHGVEHPSQPNYIALFSGSTQGIVKDDCFQTKFAAPNLYSKLKSVEKSCGYYSEDLPATGSLICKSGKYAKKHNASADFSNIPDSVNKMFTQLPADYSLLENLVFIVPNLDNDMHSGTILQGDQWIENNLGGLTTWCKTHNSLFAIAFDEDDRSTNNHIPVVFYGHNVNIGSDSIFYDHYNMTRTICSLMGAPQKWTDSLKNRNVITGF